ncbi:MAG: hypothetical protein M0038_03045 [Pseudomonadota bacterium]|jgi:hypothetical protein|nr:hypothetical protein [Pseudomonadota bacterium]
MSTAAVEILARIRAAGLTVAPDAADPGKVYVAPRERLTDELREMIRANKAALLAVLSEPANTPAANADPLPATACASCTHYTAEPGKTPDGWCRKHRTETWGAYAGGCAADWTPADPATRTLERRRAAVVAQLEADPALRYSFDVQGATPTAPADGPVSVLLGLRMGDGSIVTGELRIPGNRWPGIVLFSEHLRLAADGRPS